ncbi:MAG: four helix bundle protein [Chloroflexota bacterium]|nr:four helix bundle protein [Chloroflexota bacterium]MBI5703816.1 four helix bundle protein [Chloroflexota bacterium]
MPFRFEGLEIWHRAREFSARIHEVTVKFPRQEMYALTDQINRASDAVALLIAEGSGLQTDALFNHRLGLAVGETFEVVAGSFLALDRKYLTPETQKEMYEWGDALARKINAFRNTLR